mmetsp:Transcript_19689/g.27476  ORF Transcript_19689/g.27476 Transcript_19689/m.27476 type:complete len:111 (+) Transcript_19689:312-644(+)
MIFSIVKKPTRLVEQLITITTNDKRVLKIFIIFTITKNFIHGKKTYGKTARIKKIKNISKNIINRALDGKNIDLIYKMCYSDIIGDKIKQISKNLVRIKQYYITRIKHSK